MTMVGQPTSNVNNPTSSNMREGHIFELPHRFCLHCPVSTLFLIPVVVLISPCRNGKTSNYDAFFPPSIASVPKGHKNTPDCFRFTYGCACLFYVLTTYWWLFLLLQKCYLFHTLSPLLITDFWRQKLQKPYNGKGDALGRTPQIYL